MYCILMKYTAVIKIMLNFGGGHLFLGGFTAATKKNRLVLIFGGG